MRFKNIGIVGAGANCVFTLDVIIKRILKNKRDNFKIRLPFMKKAVISGLEMFIQKNYTKPSFK